MSYSVGELLIIVKDERTGFDPTNLADPTRAANIKSTHGRGIYLMRALMDDAHLSKGALRFTSERVSSHRNHQAKLGYPIRPVFRSVGEGCGAAIALACNLRGALRNFSLNRDSY